MSKARPVVLESSQSGSLSNAVGNPRNGVSLKPARSSAGRSVLHTAAYSCWSAGDTLQTIATKFGVSPATVWFWSKRERWKELALRALERAQERLIDQQAETVGNIKLRHARIAKLGLTKAEKKLAHDARDPDAFELQQIAAATEKFVKVERVSREIAEPEKRESPLSEVLVRILEKIDVGRARKVIDAESHRELAEPRDKPFPDGESEPQALPIGSGTQREFGVDPRDAL